MDVPEEKRVTVKRIPCEVWSRIVGYYRPIQMWHLGKQAEKKDRVDFKIPPKSIQEVKDNHSGNKVK